MESTLKCSTIVEYQQRQTLKQLLRGHARRLLLDVAIPNNNLVQQNWFADIVKFYTIIVPKTLH